MDVNTYELIAVAISFVIGLVSGRAYYSKFKRTLQCVRNCIDAIDNALTDDKVTKEEVKEIVDRCKGLLIGLK